MTVVGLGTQDDLALAEDFHDRYDISFMLLWDPSFESWRELEVRGQPQAALMSKDGKILGRWRGSFDEEEVLKLAASA